MAGGNDQSDVDVEDPDGSVVVGVVAVEVLDAVDGALDDAAVDERRALSESGITESYSCW